MFAWSPGMIAQEEVIARMRSRFPKPREPMGEAWFMSSKRKMYNELMSGDILELPLDYIQNALHEITLGKGFDQKTEKEEWIPWLRYLTPFLVLRSHESYAFIYLLENLITALAVNFEDDLDLQYRGFHKDLINSLGIAVMHPMLWTASATVDDKPYNRVPNFLLKELNNGKLRIELVGFGAANPMLSSIMFFCLKYLSPDEIVTWVESIFRIEHPHWRIAFLVWLAGSRQFLAEPSYKSLDYAVPEITWANSHLLEKRHDLLIPARNIQVFSEKICEHLTKELTADWWKQFESEPRISKVTGLNWLRSRMHAWYYKKDGP